MSELRELLGIAQRAALVAADVIMPLYRSGTAVELKADRTPVTSADRGAEEALRAFFARETPAFGVLGEEFPEVLGDGRHRWILDPIDGTKSFIHHVPLFGTLIALERDGEPVVGVIACHAAGETVSGATGCGAWLNGETQVYTSRETDLARATISTTSYRRWQEKHPRSYAALASCGLSRAWGDCYGYLMVATGRAEVMLDPEMNIWDAAALYPVIREAGGEITTWEGDRSVGESVAASNGPLHPQLLQMLRADFSPEDE
ncbi:MAG: inositol monophosphatase family protein [Dehalococcoidia bacterium]